MERDDVPEIKGYVRADFFGGYIIRGVEENQSKITFTFHVDGKVKIFFYKFNIFFRENFLIHQNLY